MEEDQLPIDRDYFKQKLVALRNELLQIKETGNQAAEVVELDQTRVGRLSRMDALQAQAVSLESNRRREIRLQRIESALQRIEKDKFGWCLDCGEEINRKRLEFDPASLLCIDCANKKEK